MERLINLYSPAFQTAMSHLLLRVFCLMIIERECATLVQQSSGMPAIMGNYILASVFILAFLCCFGNLKIGFMIGIIAGTINILAKIIIIINGHEHFPYYPIVWITQCLIIIYFCYRGWAQTS